MKKPSTYQFDSTYDKNHEQLSMLSFKGLMVRFCYYIFLLGFIILLLSLIFAEPYNSSFTSYSISSQHKSIINNIFELNIDLLYIMFGYLSWGLVVSLILGQLVFLYFKNSNFLKYWFIWFFSCFIVWIGIGLVVINYFDSKESFKIVGLLILVLSSLFNNNFYITCAIGVIITSLSISYAFIKPFTLAFNKFWEQYLSPQSRQRRKEQSLLDAELDRKLKEETQRVKQQQTIKFNPKPRFVTAYKGLIKLKSKVNNLGNQVGSSIKSKFLITKSYNNTNKKQLRYPNFYLYKKIAELHSQKIYLENYFSETSNHDKYLVKHLVIVQNLLDVNREHLKLILQDMSQNFSLEQIKQHIEQIDLEIQKIKDRPNKSWLARGFYALNESIKDSEYKDVNIIKKLRIKQEAYKDLILSYQALKNDFSEINELQVSDLDPDKVDPRDQEFIAQAKQNELASEDTTPKQKPRPKLKHFFKLHYIAVRGNKELAPHIHVTDLDNVLSYSYKIYIQDQIDAYFKKLKDKQQAEQEQLKKQQEQAELDNFISQQVMLSDYHNAAEQNFEEFEAHTQYDFNNTEELQDEENNQDVAPAAVQATAQPDSLATVEDLGVLSADDNQVHQINNIEDTPVQSNMAQTMADDLDSMELMMQLKLKSEAQILETQYSILNKQQTNKFYTGYHQFKVTIPYLSEVTNNINFVNNPDFNGTPYDMDINKKVSEWLSTTGLPFTSLLPIYDRSLIRLIVNFSEAIDLQQFKKAFNQIPNSKIAGHTISYAIFDNKLNLIVERSPIELPYKLMIDSLENDFKPYYKYILGNNLYATTVKVINQNNRITPQFNRYPNILGIYQHNVYVTGEPHSGITTTLESLVYSISLFNQFNIVKLAIIPSNNNTVLSNYSELPNLFAPLIDNEDDAAIEKFINYLYNEFNKRTMCCKIFNSITNIAQFNEAVTSQDGILDSLILNDGVTPIESPYNFSLIPLLVVVVDNYTKLRNSLRRVELHQIFDNLIKFGPKYGIQFVIGDNHLHSSLDLEDFTAVIALRHNLNDPDQLKMRKQIFDGNSNKYPFIFNSSDSWIRFKVDEYTSKVYPNSIAKINPRETSDLIRNVANLNPTRFNDYNDYQPNLELNMVSELIIDAANSIDAKHLNIGQSGKFDKKKFSDNLETQQLLIENEQGKKQLISLIDFIYKLPAYKASFNTRPLKLNNEQNIL